MCGYGDQGDMKVACCEVNTSGAFCTFGTSPLFIGITGIVGKDFQKLSAYRSSLLTIKRTKRKAANRAALMALNMSLRVLM